METKVEQVGNDLFGKRRSVVPLTTKYRHKPLEEAVKEIVKRHCKTHPNGTCDGNDWFPWNIEEEEDPVSSLVLRPGEQICHSYVHPKLREKYHMWAVMAIVRT